MRPTYIQRLILLRRRDGITQLTLSLGIGFRSNYCGQWEAGNRKPSINHIIAIANYFKVSTDYLLGLTSNPERLQ